MINSGLILTLAYPDTIDHVAEEWYSGLLRFIGIGRKKYVRAGHAALVLINKETGILEYHDFGRYITPEPNGRVRGLDTDNELQFPIKAEFNDGVLQNLDAILEFLATHPKLTHGDGKLLASVCNSIDYTKARKHISAMQNKHFIRYAAFIKDACNCARFVTDALINSVTNVSIKKKLNRSKWFTPSTVGNVLLADTEDFVYEVSETGNINKFEGSQTSENLRCFLDRLPNFEPTQIGKLEPKPLPNLHKTAQWLPGIAAGAWFELIETETKHQFRYRRISPYGNIDVDALFETSTEGFNYNEPFEFVPYSNCLFFHIKQHETLFKFVKIKS